MPAEGLARPPLPVSFGSGADGINDLHGVVGLERIALAVEEGWL